MQPIRTILHPTDFSEHADDAYRVSRLIAQACGARVILLHVLQLHQLEPAGGSPQLELATNYISPEDRLQERAERDRTMETEIRIVEGDPATEILRAAQDLGCDLLVMGSHGQGGSGHPMGRVTAKVVSRCRCPFLTILSPPAKETTQPGLSVPLNLNAFTSASEQSSMQLRPRIG